LRRRGPPGEVSAGQRRAVSLAEVQRRTLGVHAGELTEPYMKAVAVLGGDLNSRRASGLFE
jgi:hypothetical protein